jgi:TatD DNase family protein
MIDTHCHLTFPDFVGRHPALLGEAAAAGVTGCISISTNTGDCLDALAIARMHANVWCSAGVHPLYAEPKDGQPHYWPNLLAVARDPRCVAWGELGLDNHYPTPTPAVQRAVLDEQLAFIESVNHDGPGGIGKRGGLPVVIHCREASRDLLPVLARTTIDPGRFVFHCFTGDAAEATRILDFGALISFTGIATYPNASEVLDAAKRVPIDRIMVETDAPFLPPMPHRGKRPCVPAWAIHTARFLADARGERFEDFHAAINANTERFFGIRVPG